MWIEGLVWKDVASLYSVLFIAFQLVNMHINRK